MIPCAIREHAITAIIVDSIERYHMRGWRRVLLALSLFVPGLAPASDAGKLPLDRIRLPDGFDISVFADDVPNARGLTRGERGTIFVGSRRAGNVYAVVDRDGDDRADAVHILAKGLLMPTGVAFRDGALFVAEVNRILRFDGIEKNLESPPEPVVLPQTYPKIRHHGWKFIAFGPDGMLYVPVGAPCNTCESKEEIFASITRMKPDGTGFEVYAHGVRNTVGFDWHPKSGDLWFTDNGRDWLGDDSPPDELNVAGERGAHFGYPYCHGADISDPDFGEKRSCSAFTPPARNLGPHVAALGMRFYTGTRFPEAYRGSILIAEHGSWNRSEPIGYRVMRIRLDGDRAVSYDVFAEGWLQEGDAWGRPADLEVMPDGAILISDDHAGVIYRIAYTGSD
jgi:glucose/arabinose dehydrogenase